MKYCLLGPKGLRIFELPLEAMPLGILQENPDQERKATIMFGDTLAQIEGLCGPMT